MARRPSTTMPLELPLDVKLMTWVANGLIVAAVMLGLGALALWAARQPAWSLGGISVHGDVEHQNEITLRTQVAQRLQGTFLTLDLQEVKRLFEAVPWVRRAVVQREFPNRLRVTLEEHQPAAWWGEAGAGKLINVQGEIFEATPDDPAAESWSTLSGPDGYAPRVFALYQALKPVLEPLGLQVQRLQLDTRGSWRAELSNGARLELGRGDQDVLLARIDTFTRTVEQLTQRYGRDLEAVDLRYPNGYAVRLRGVTTVAEPAPRGAPVR